MVVRPDYNHDLDNQQIANEEHEKNLGDNRTTLGTLFKGMGAAEKTETRFAKKWFPSEKYEKDTSSPLLKVAHETLSASDKFRNSPAHYKAAAVRSFTDELEKIAWFGVDDAVGGLIGYTQGKKQKARGEEHTFGGPQVAGAVFLPGGAGYQVGRYFGHNAEHLVSPVKKTPETK
jgi:hypothetical protein